MESHFFFVFVFWGFLKERFHRALGSRVRVVEYTSDSQGIEFGGHSMLDGKFREGRDFISTGLGKLQGEIEGLGSNVHEDKFQLGWVDVPGLGMNSVDDGVYF